MAKATAINKEDLVMMDGITNDNERLLPTVSSSSSASVPTSSSSTSAETAPPPQDMETINEFLTVEDKIDSLQLELAQWKLKGNQYFSLKMYQEAADAYQQGLLAMAADDFVNTTTTTSSSEIKPLEAALRANRAMALLKLQDYDQAEHESNLSLQLDPTNFKVWYRRALAREGRAMALTSSRAKTSNNHQSVNAMAVLLLEQAQSDVQYCLKSLDHSNNNGTQKTLTKKEAAERQSMIKDSGVVLQRVQECLTKWKQPLSQQPSQTTAAERDTVPPLDYLNGDGDFVQRRENLQNVVPKSIKPPPQLSPERPPPEQQRKDVVRLLMGRQVSLKDQHQQLQQQDRLVAKEGEAFFLVDWSWWCAWCEHVNFYSKDQPRQANFVLNLLLPGASLPSSTTTTTDFKPNEDDTTDEDDSSEEENETKLAPSKPASGPSVIDNSKLLLFVPSMHDDAAKPLHHALSDFYRHWYLHSVLNDDDYNNDDEYVHVDATITTTTGIINGETITEQPQPQEQLRQQLWLRPNLVRGYHYELLPREVYSALRDWYGEVSPSICRRASFVTDAATSTTATTNNNGTSNHNSQQPKVVIVLYPERCSSRDRLLQHVDHDRLDLDPPLPKPCSPCCAGCRAPYAQRRCQQCRLLHYCDRTCQESHWPYHRLDCKRLSIARPDEIGDAARTLTFGGGRVGLNNLGNTCFMNSALQCLSHATPLTRHFLSNRFQADLNAANPLGTGGKLAMAYASVLRDLWMMGRTRGTSSNLSTSPTALKRAIAAFAPRFAGCSQHDAQEFLAYLLDGLHEDLNRIRRAPYVEMPDVSKEPNMAVAGARVWDAHQRRNDSLVLDTFYGQFQSTCVCPKCRQVSVSFDAFNHISLEIPQPNQNLLLRRIIPILLFRAPNKHMNCPTKVAVVPQRYGVMVLRHGTTIADVKLALSDLCGISPDHLAICDVYDHGIYDIIPDNKSVQSIRANDVLAAYEIDPYTNKTIHVVANQVRVTKHNHLHDAATPSQLPDGDTTVAPPPSSSPMEETRTLFAYPLLTSFSSDLTCQQVWDHMWNLVRHCVMKSDGSSNDDSSLPSQQQQQQEPAYTEKRLQQALQIRLVENNGKPLNIFTSVLSSSSSSSSPENQEGRPADDNEENDDQGSLLPRSLNETLANFLEKDCTENFLYMSLEWSDIHDEEEALSKDGVASPVQQNPFILDDEKFLAFEDHPSLNEAIQRHQALSPNNKSVTLDQCFETFTRPERLDEHNKWYCSNCKEHVSAMKTMQLWRLPNILVVHLKRFEFKHGLRRDKLDTLVDFPLEDLDMSKHCALYHKTTDDGFVIDDQVPAMYDLFAVTNHYGRMGFGHYTAYARSWDERSGMSPDWNLFDDSSVQSVGDGRGTHHGKLPTVVSAAAYVLFYRRRMFS